MLGVYPLDRAEELGLNPERAQHIRQGRLAFFESYEDLSLMAFAWSDDQAAKGGAEEVRVWLDRENLIVFAQDDKLLSELQRRLPADQPNDRALYELFGSMLYDDMDHLDKLEAEVTDVEDDALRSSRGVYLEHIVRYRKILLHLKRYYTRLDAIFDSLAANANGLLSEEGVRLFEVLLGRNQRYLDSAVHLRDYVTQMREAYQAQIDIEQNNLMKVFTVVTAVSTPLTLIAGWYGMNFENMPELAWHGSYYVVLASGALVTIGLLILFRRKKWI